MDEWYNEIRNIALNDKLTCNIKVKKGELKKNSFYEIWGRFLKYVNKRKGESSKSRINSVLGKRTIKEEEEYRWKKKIIARDPIYGGGEHSYIVF